MEPRSQRLYEMKSEAKAKGKVNVRTRSGTGREQYKEIVTL